MNFLASSFRVRLISLFDNASCVFEHFYNNSCKFFGADIKRIDQPQFPGRTVPGHIGAKEQPVRAVLVHNGLGNGLGHTAVAVGNVKVYVLDIF